MTTVFFANQTSLQNTPVQNPELQAQAQSSQETAAYSSGKGSYKAPSGSTTDGNRTGPAPGYRTGPRAPSTDVTRPRYPSVNQPVPQPAPKHGWGSFFFGGMAAGAFLGHILHPFGGMGYGTGYTDGYAGSGGFSILGLIFWGVILFIAYKLFRRFWGGNK